MGYWGSIPASNRPPKIAMKSKQQRVASRTPESGIPRGARRMFGVKDLFTSMNALSGVVGIYYCIKGRPLTASYAFLAGYAADCLDGLVARATRSSNRFGSEFDTAADFVAQAVAPAFVVYCVYG